ncbi:transposase [Wenzhouxiangella sp. EGI_FJ10305]|uniref:transposase n=1 Tax=Wenzhouxiangella sp. EGI_FJ10305 TaxID=3243768 RepID=UPI0035D905FF
MKYSEERRQAVLAKVCPPHNRTVLEVAAEEGISEATVYNWRKQARERGELYPDAGSDAQGWSARPVCQHPSQQHLIGFICNIQGANGVEICLIPMRWLPTRALKNAPVVGSV